MATKTRKPRKTVAPEEEDPRQRFLRIGQPRMNRALTAITLLGNMSNPQYRWYESDLQHMKTTLMIAVTEMLDRFESKLRAKRKAEFHFSPSDEEVLGLNGNGRQHEGS